MIRRVSLVQPESGGKLLYCLGIGGPHFKMRSGYYHLNLMVFKEIFCKLGALFSTFKDYNDPCQKITDT